MSDTVKSKTKPKLKTKTKTKSKTNRKIGRPKKKIDYKLVKKLANIQCTQEEISSVLDISVKTLVKDDEFLRIYKMARDNGKRSLRRMQWKKAKSGSATMLIWLGKQYLGQSDKREDKVIDSNFNVTIDNKPIAE